MKIKNKPILVVLALFSIFALTTIACTGSGDVDTGSKSDENENSESTSEPVIYSQDDVVEIDGKKISILEVKNYTDTNQFMQPSDGMRFLAIKMSEQNVSDEAVSYNALNYKLVDKDGAEYSQGFSSIEPSFNSGDLQPTRKAMGYLVYEVTEGTENSYFELIYEPLSFVDTVQVVWTLN